MTSPNFSELELSADTLASVERAGYVTPTPVQLEAVPVLLAGHDAHIQAQTGTGKTAAFVLPTVDRLERNPGRVEVLVLVPTRELAQQVSDEFTKLGAARGLESAAIYGGTSFEKQYKALETAQIVVATPGRLLDLNRRGRFNFGHVRIFGLDEADEMLSMGFDRDVLDIAGMLPPARQSFLCSATFNDPILRMAQSITRSPRLVNCSSDAVGAQSVRHVWFRVPDGTRSEAVLRLITYTGTTGAIVFCNTRASSFRVVELLQADGRNADVLNGELSQSEREVALARMRQGEVDFLVATDVAARGIDISGLPAVINYDMPDSPDVYIHRTGRTGRAGQAGVAYSLVAPSDITVFHALQKFFKLTFHNERLPNAADLRTMRADRMLDALLSDLDAGQNLPYGGFMPLADRLRTRDDSVREIAKLLAFWGEHRATVRPPADVVAASIPAPLETPSPSDAPAAASPGLPVVSAAATHLDAETAREAVATAPSGNQRGRSRRGAAAEASATAQTAASSVAPEATPAFSGAEASSVGATPASKNPVFDWLMGATDVRSLGRFFAVDAMADELGMPEHDVIAMADSHELIERARSGDPLWRLRRPAIAHLFERRGPRPSNDDRAAADGPAPDRAAPAPAATASVAASVAPPKPAVAVKESNAPAEAEAVPPSPKPTKPTKPTAAPVVEAATTADARPPRAARSPRPSPPVSAAPSLPQSTVEATLPPVRSDAQFIVVRVNLGRDLFANARVLADTLVEMAGLDREDLGRVVLEQDYSLVPVRRGYSEDFVAALRAETVAGRRLQIVPLPPA